MCGGAGKCAFERMCGLGIQTDSTHVHTEDQLKCVEELADVHVRMCTHVHIDDPLNCA